MKTINSVLLIFALFLCGCVTPAHLPTSESIDVHQYGSYISIEQIEGHDINGELLAIDSTQMIILPETWRNAPSSAVIVPVSKVKHFSLRYAESVSYGWMIPTSSLLVFIHGWFSLITYPINLAGSIAVTASSNGTFKYNDKEISLGQLKMFARFPQGIPHNIKLEIIQ